MRPMKPRRPEGPHEALALMMDQIGETAGNPEAGVTMAATFEGVSRFTLYKELDPDQPAELAFARVARLTAHFCVPAAAAHLARLCGHLMVPLPPGQGHELLASEMGHVATEIGQVITAIGRALGDDGRVDQAEARRILKEIREAMQSLAALAEAVKAEAERGAGGKDK